MKKVTITIGIPAYNEEANISSLLNDIAKQQSKEFALEKVIVASDGSDDRTVELAKEIQSIPIEVIDNKKRHGKSFVLNQILRKANSDILVLLDADTRLLANDFLPQLIKPIVKNRIDLTSAKVEELPPHNFFQEILAVSMQMKKRIFEQYNLGNNLYTCHGRSRALSKNLYKKLTFKGSAAEDAYSYLYCISRGFKYQYVSETAVYYELPSSYSDHKKQSLRFFGHHHNFPNDFTKKILDAAYRLPSILSLKELLLSFRSKPVHLSAYLLIVTLLKVEKILTRQNFETWEIAQSSKQIVRNKKMGANEK